MNEPPAPQNILDVILCGCKKGCDRACSCRKAGLLCTQSCKYCLGLNCNNSSNYISSATTEENKEKQEIDSDNEEPEVRGSPVLENDSDYN